MFLCLQCALEVLKSVYLDRDTVVVMVLEKLEKIV
jgi:hypothetical protein